MIPLVHSFLDWSTLTWSPSRAAWDEGYVAAWNARRERAKALPLLGRFMRAWEAAGPHARP